jgi:ribosomal subunit interface protein
MQTHVSILHRDYPARVRGIVEQRLSDLGRYYDRIVTVSARLERSSRQSGARCRVELVANVGHGNVLVASVHRDGLRSALDDAVHTLQRRLSKHHDKVKLERRRRRS